MLYVIYKDGEFAIESAEPTENGCYRVKSGLWADKIVYGNSLKELPAKYQSLEEVGLKILGTDARTLWQGLSCESKRNSLLNAAKTKKVILGPNSEHSDLVHSLSPEGLQLIIKQIENELGELLNPNLEQALSSLKSILSIKQLVVHAQLSPEAKGDPVISFIDQRLRGNLDFAQIRTIAKELLEVSASLPAETKEQQMFNSLSLMAKGTGQSLYLDTRLLATLEVVLLSKFYSDLGTKAFLARKVSGANNHSWLASGVKEVLSCIYSNLSINYLTLPITDKDCIGLLDKLKNNPHFWIVLGYEGTFHFSLLRVNLLANQIKCFFFDSLGTAPQKHFSLRAIALKIT
jgi:hypothetical protein